MKILNYPSSGSYQNLTFSRNRYGQYTRSRAIPVNPASTFQTAVRLHMAQNAQAWRDLTATQRNGWTDLGLQILRTDSLGQSYNLNGFGAFCMVNNNRLLVGDTALTDAPLYDVPDALASVTPTITSASFSMAYTVTPQPASTRVLWYAGPQRSAGRTFEGDMRFMLATATAAASPTVLLATYQGRFGTPVTGNRIFVSGATYRNGFVSLPLLTSTIVA